MRIALFSQGRIHYWGARGFRVWVPAAPSPERLVEELRRAGGVDYLGLGPEVALVRQTTLPYLPEASLEELILSEAELNPQFRGEPLRTAHHLLEVAGSQARYLYAALPRKDAEVLERRLRPKRLEPLPLLFWRLVEERRQAEPVLLLESFSHTLAYLAGGQLRGFRYLNTPLDGSFEAVEAEVLRTLELFGLTREVEEAWLIGSFTPPVLPARRVIPLEPTLPLLQEVALQGEPQLDLRPGTPRRAALLWPTQLLLLYSALVLSAGLVGQSYLQSQIRRVERLYQAMRDEPSLASQTAELPTLDSANLVQAARLRPPGLWFTLSEENGEVFRLLGEALDPQAPIELTRRLQARLVVLREVEQRYVWEIQRTKTPR